MSSQIEIGTGTTALAVVPTESPVTSYVTGDDGSGVAASAPLSLTLYETEQLLATLTEDDGSEELTELERGVLHQIADAAARDKRDAVARFIRMVDCHVLAVREEEKRLAARRHAAERKLERLEAYVVWLIERYGPEPKGRVKSKRLEGNVFILSAQNNPAALEVTDEAKISDLYKRATLEMPFPLWLQVAEWLTEDDRRLIDVKVAVDNALVRAALDAKTPVEGATLKQSKRLVVR